MNRKWLIGIGFVAVVALLVWANLRKAGPEGSAATAAGQGPKNAPQVKVAKLAPRNLTQRVMAPGALEATQPREIRAPFATQRVKLLVGAGDRVTEGQVIAELEAEDLRVQVASLEAALARAESSYAQLRQQQQSSPLALSVKLQTAQAQLVAAEGGVHSALKQAETAQQKLEQARAALLSVQNRAAVGSADVNAARDKLSQAEAAYRANPLSAANQAAYEAAQAAYQDAVRRSADSARQLATDLSNAYENVALAEKDVTETGEDSAAVRQARAQLESARLAVEAAQADMETGGVTVEQIRSVEAELAAQGASLEAARAKLAQAQFKAPVTGTVLTADIKSGQPAQTGQLLCIIGGLDVLTVRAKVDEVDVGKVKVGQSLSITNNAYPGVRFEGKVTRVAAQSSAPDPRLGTAGGTFYEVQGEVANPEGKLRAGMSAEARVITDQRSNVLVVGLESVREEGEKASVLVVTGGKVEVRPVKLGLRTQTTVEVVEGLKEGDQVIVAPFTLIKNLKDGDAVRFEVVPADDRGDEE
ncbi:MAG TPA: efflux RND transporter periplasmic adaptor subunit [Symbiobacteriaceae bacterium]|nr:efflux RND transporter periplasmic adaptor subunit [Symbiobacteriaceae bacterium]